MRLLFLLVVCLFPSAVLAQACTITSQGQALSVTLCQQNRTIPEKMFHDGFCNPKLKDQTVSVAFSENCPEQSFGVCQGAQTGGMYQYDIYYYGVASDALFLQPACQQQHNGTWVKP